VRSLLADIADGGAHAAQDSVRVVRDAVLAHLRELCETVRGSVLVAPDYGFEDATQIFYEFPRSRERARLRLEQAIRRYEPRLADTSVAIDRADEEEDGNLAPDLMLRFVITAALIVDGRRVPTQFTSVLRHDKTFDVR
jgi:type VI secretion system lysozyme-like protein